MIMKLEFMYFFRMESEMEKQRLLLMERDRTLQEAKRRLISHSEVDEWTGDEC